MDRSDVSAKAAEYVALESHEYFRRQVQELIDGNAMEELSDRFYRDLEFGTGGLRGVIGGGYNRMNPYVVKRATQGLANYVRKAVTGRQPMAVVAYDSRNFSDLFALETALVFAANGIKTWLFTGLRPTPELSFAIRHLKADTGVVLTASHNPPQYNGYKAYWNDGGQLVPPHDKAVIDEVLAVGSAIRSMGKDEALAKGLLVMVDEEVDAAYIAMIKKQALRPQLIREKGSSLRVVYTPLHGSGGMPVGRVLSEMGVPVTYVEQQRQPDGNFPTVKSPNPEEPSAMKMAIETARAVKADLVIGTDPDADRIGIAVPDGGEYRLVTGNQFGAIVADYMFATLREQGRMPERPAFIKTIVTTELQRAIAASYGVACHDVLTGFKYIAEKIRLWESQPSGPQYVFGGEESYGFLVGTSVRDKDAVSAAAMIAEVALYAVSQGQSLLDRLNDIYRRFGYHAESQIAKGFEGQAGARKMASLMDGLRRSPPREFAGQAVREVRDYRDGTVLNPANGARRTAIDLPSSNVLQFVLADKSVVTARPSGTEPKIKFYIMCCSAPGMDLAQAQAEVAGKIKRIGEQIGSLIA